MASGAARPELVHKHFRLDGKKLKRVQRALNVTTETEAVERALDMVLTEHERNRIVEETHRRFLTSGVVIRDVFGVLKD